jgi:tetratricopeptide (TPR) repeat protein
VQLAIARHGLPNDPEAALLEAYMTRRQGYFEKAVQRFDEALSVDPRNLTAILELGGTFYMIRQFAACEREYDRAIDLAPDQPMFKALKGEITPMKTADDAALSSVLATLPASMADDRGVMTYRLNLALYQRNWKEATARIDQIGGGEDDAAFAGSTLPVPVGCYSILIARLQGKPPELDSSLAEPRQQLSQKVQSSGGNAMLLSNLAIVDALLGKKEDALAEAKRAVETLPILKDAVNGPIIMTHLAAVYAWTNEQNSAFETLEPLTKTPNGLYYGDLKLNPLWDPLRNDPRFDKLLAQLAPRN